MTESSLAHKLDVDLAIDNVAGILRALRIADQEARSRVLFGHPGDSKTVAIEPYQLSGALRECIDHLVWRGLASAQKRAGGGVLLTLADEPPQPTEAA
jgi:RNase P/RNase MRP subunit POP5